MSLGKILAAVFVCTLAWFAGSPSSQKTKEMAAISQQAERAYDEFRCEKDGLSLASDGNACESTTGSRHPIHERS